MSIKQQFIDTLKLPLAIGLDLLGKKRLLQEIESFNMKHGTDFTIDFKEGVIKESGHREKSTWDAIVESIKGGKLIPPEKEVRRMSPKDHYRTYLETKRPLSY